VIEDIGLADAKVNDIEQEQGIITAENQVRIGEEFFFLKN
jgi:hypothetical protein